MAERTVNLKEPETEMNALKETLQSQQQLLKELYTELEQERESSATAANETLSAILRLQGQKAKVEMEASQYKRMTEEKLVHAEESLVGYEDLLYHKEMEISGLEYQVQAFRFKLLSMGCSDFDIGETNLSENFMLQRSQSQNGDMMGVHRDITRNSSLPPFPLKGQRSNRGGFERERSSSPLLAMIPTIVEENLEIEIISDNLGIESFDSYLEKIKKLDEKVKGISDNSLPCSLSSQVSYDPKNEYNFNNNLFENEDIMSSKIQDIFEVPQTNHDRTNHGKREKEDNEWYLEDRLEKPSENDISIKKMHASINANQAEIKLLNERVEKIENEQRIAKHECIEGGEEGMKLMKEMHELLNSILFFIRNWRVKKSPPMEEDPHLLPLTEAMLYFWL